MRGKREVKSHKERIAGCCFLYIKKNEGRGTQKEKKKKQKHISSEEAKERAKSHQRKTE